MTSHKPSTRKDVLEGVGVSLEVLRRQEERKAKAKEFECLDGEDGRFTFAAAGITVMEVKQKKKRKR